jgi:hypothetical protein
VGSVNIDNSNPIRNLRIFPPANSGGGEDKGQRV